MEYKTMPKLTERYQRGIRASAHYEGAFVDLLNREMKELLESYENIEKNNKNNINMEQDKNVD